MGALLLTALSGHGAVGQDFPFMILDVLLDGYCFGGSKHVVDLVTTPGHGVSEVWQIEDK